MTKTIKSIAEGKAATIVSPSQLAVNVGSAKGVQIGDIVTVRRSVEVTDPDSKKTLGKVHLNRLRLRVTLISDSFSVGTVTDEAPASSFVGLDITRISRLKTVVPTESEADDSSVFVSPGEPVVITRIVEVKDDGDEPDA